MGKGSWTNGIPVLDPFVFPVDLVLSIPASAGGVYELTLRKLTFSGLSTFKIEGIGVDPISRDMHFNTLIQNLTMGSDYDLSYRIN